MDLESYVQSHLYWILNQGITDRAALFQRCQQIYKENFSKDDGYCSHWAWLFISIAKTPTCPLSSVAIMATEGHKARRRSEPSARSLKRSLCGVWAIVRASSWLKSLKRSDCQRSPCSATPYPTLPYIPSICKHFFSNYAIAISDLPSPGIGPNLYKHQID